MAMIIGKSIIENRWKVLTIRHGEREKNSASAEFDGEENRDILERIIC